MCTADCEHEGDAAVLFWLLKSMCADLFRSPICCPRRCTAAASNRKGTTADSADESTSAEVRSGPAAFCVQALCSTSPDWRRAVLGVCWLRTPRRRLRRSRICVLCVPMPVRTRCACEHSLCTASRGARWARSRIEVYRLVWTMTSQTFGH